MRYLITILLSLIFSFVLRAQDKDLIYNGEFILGCPAELEPIVSSFGKPTHYLDLNSGVDSIKVIVGAIERKDKTGHWISLYKKGKLSKFMTLDLQLQADPDVAQQRIDVDYDNSGKFISVWLSHNYSSNEIQYKWLADEQPVKSATLNFIEKKLQKNTRFPSIEFRTLQDETISFDELKGNYIVINWWATTCGPCLLEMPGLNSLVDKYKEHSNVIFIAIAYDQRARLEKFLTRREFKYIQTLGSEEDVQIFGNSFPMNLIVNPDGIISYYSEGGNEDMHIAIAKELDRQIGTK